MFSCTHTRTSIQRSLSTHMNTHPHRRAAVFLYAHQRAYRRRVWSEEKTHQCELKLRTEIFFLLLSLWLFFKIWSTDDARLHPRMQPKRSRVQLLTDRLTRRAKQPPAEEAAPPHTPCSGAGDEMRKRGRLGRKNLVKLHWSYWRLGVDKLSSAHAHYMAGVGGLGWEQCQKMQICKLGLPIFIQIFLFFFLQSLK